MKVIARLLSIPLTLIAMLVLWLAVSPFTPHISYWGAGSLIGPQYIGPLLLIAGGKDHIVPASVTRANYNLYRKSKAVTDFKEYPDRSHYTVGQPGWEEVADYALNWAVEHAASAHQTAPTGATAGRQ